MPPVLSAWSTVLHAARSGNPDALGELLDQCRTYLLAIANRSLPDDLRVKAGASDIVQDSLLEAQRDFGRFGGQSSEEWHGWLRGILQHNLANHTRRYRDTHKRGIARETPWGETFLEPEAYDLTPGAEAVRREEEALLTQALQELPETYHRVIVWRTLEARPFEEVGRLLGRSPDAARMLWGRAVEQLRQTIEARR